MKFNYSVMKTVGKGLLSFLITALALGSVEYLQRFVAHPVDLPLGGVIIPAAVLTMLARMLINVLKQRE